VSLGFANEREEAQGVAKIARALIDAGVAEHEIMVLLRSDRNGAFSSVIDEEMRALRVPAIVRTKESTPLNTASGRLLLGYLRLLIDPRDDLAWRSILDMPGNGVGDKAIAALHDLSAGRNEAFAQTLAAVAADPLILPRYGSAAARTVNTAAANLEHLREEDPQTPGEAVEAVATVLGTSVQLDEAKSELLVLSATYDSGSLSDFLSAIALRKEEEEAIVPRTVNILSAHKAKGLDACAVIIPAADEELVPGGNHVDEERRLFYVSLTRARHLLMVTHATTRRGQQAMSGEPIGGRNHRRTTFMDASGVRAVSGRAFSASFVPDPRLLTPPSKGGVE
jgi:DNA helicase-2/ATP-dependent DNA helicase PcrA